MVVESFTGIVLKGKRCGRVLGYPTINIQAMPVPGIYAARVKIDDGEHMAAAFADPSRGLLEAHLLDYSGDLYGREVTVVLHEKLRDSKRFEDETALRSAIAQDVVAVRSYFK